MVQLSHQQIFITKFNKYWTCKKILIDVKIYKPEIVLATGLGDGEGVHREDCKVITSYQQLVLHL